MPEPSRGIFFCHVVLPQSQPRLTGTDRSFPLLIYDLYRSWPLVLLYFSLIASSAVRTQQDGLAFRSLVRKTINVRKRQILPLLPLSSCLNPTCLGYFDAELSTLYGNLHFTISYLLELTQWQECRGLETVWSRTFWSLNLVRQDPPTNIAVKASLLGLLCISMRISLFFGALAQTSIVLGHFLTRNF